jgi:autotransporter-associated beta strand protein
MHPSTTRHALLASTALTTLLLVAAPPTRAADATWTGAVSGNYMDAANWTPAQVPGDFDSGTAFFSGGSQTTSVFIGAPIFVQTLDAFVIDEASYTFTSAADTLLQFVGAGIVTLNGGSATYINNGFLDFTEASSAGSASITNTASLSFRLSGTAGTATITNQPGGSVVFLDNSTGGNAAFINGGTVDFSPSSGPNGDRKLSAGSIAGPGSYILGANELTVGGNGNSTEVSGVISGVGGSLVKVGQGTQTLSGINTYTGGTTISAGTLQLGTLASTAAIQGVVNVGADGTLDIVNADTGGITGIANGGSINFRNATSAGSATITNSRSIAFFDSSTAGSATITNDTAGFIGFNDGSKGGNAAITNSGTVFFDGNSTADNAIIVNTNTLSFGSRSTAGNATITNTVDGTVLFGEGSTAGNATIINAGSALFLMNGTGGNATIVNNSDGTVDFSGSTGPNGDHKLTAGSIAGAGSYILGANELTVGGNGNSTEVSGVISGVGGSLVKTGAGTLILSGIDTYTGGTTVNAGTLQLGSNSSAGAIRGAVNVGAAGTFNIFNADTTGVTSVTNAGITNFRTITTAGTATITNSGSLNFRDASMAGGSTITNTGELTFREGGKAATATISNERSGVLNFNEGSSADNARITNQGSVWFSEGGKAGHARIENKSGDVNFLHGTTAENATIINDDRLVFRFAATAGNASIINSGSVDFNGAATGGNAAILNIAGGVVDFRDTNGPQGDGKVSAGSIAGAGDYLIALNELTVGGDNRSTEVSGVISGLTGSLVKTGAGTLTLSGANDYGGATTVNAGMLSVNGSITASSGVTVNAGGTLGGSGQLAGVTVNAGGNLAPGNSIGTLTVNGDLQFGMGSFYTVEVSPTAADRTNVTGAATLTGATVRAAALPGSFRGQTYTILNATGGLGGTTFAGFNVSGSFAPARNPRLAYDANNAYLVLDPNTLTLSQNATRNQTSVAGAINRTVERGGAPPAGFDTLLNMPGPAVGRALDQLSGESSTQAQAGAFQLGTSYLALLTDPFARGRVETAAPLGFAAEGRRSAAPAILSAYAAAVPSAAVDTPRWDVWGAAFGGGNAVGGDPGGAGSHDLSMRAGAIAAGAVYRFAPGSLVGFSLAGGSTNWSVSGNGSGKSDVFMAGVYGRHTSGPAYIGAAASFANHWMSTTRTVTVAGLDQLKASFNGASFGGRIEGGYRLTLPALTMSWTPYGAIQGQSFRTAGYTEAAAIGSNQFALSVASRTASAWRAEAGMQADRAVAVGDGGELRMFGKAAFAHDAISTPALAANFAVLGPTGSFTALGAQPSQNLLLASSGAEWQLAGGLSLMLKAGAEWGERSRTYSGTGRIRYSW